MPGRDLNLHAIAVCITVPGAEVCLDLGNISGIVQVHLASLHVFELRMIDELLADDLTTDEENTLDLEGWFITEHADLTEGVLSEAFKSLDETFKKVLEHVLNLTFLANLFVVEEPEGPTLTIDL